MARALVVVHDQDKRAELKVALPEQLPLFAYTFVPGVDEAIGALADGHYDVVVGDARIPGFDDPILLRMVHQTYPHTIRIALISQISEANSLRLSQVAHQAIMNSSSPEQIAETIRRTYRLFELLDDPAVRRRVTDVKNLPSAPQVYTALVTAMSDPDVSMRALSEVVRRDPGISAKILQLVNSAFFGRTQPTTELEDAVAFLGISALRGLVLQLEVTRQFSGGNAARLGLLEGFQTHGLSVAVSVSSILAGHPDAKEGFSAGLLHDVGKLVLAEFEPDAYHKVIDEMMVTGEPAFAIEQRMFGTTHAEVGAALLAMWGLPTSIVEAVGCHHAPGRAGPQFGLVGAVHVANALVHDATSLDERKQATALLNQEWVESSGIGERIERWSKSVEGRLSA